MENYVYKQTNLQEIMPITGSNIKGCLIFEPHEDEKQYICDWP